MAARLGVVVADGQSTLAIAAHSAAALDRPLGMPAELWVAVATDEARLLGAFQRGTGLPDAPRLARRASGGPEVLVGPATVYVGLALAHPSALVACDEKRIVNRLVRPLLRALNGCVGAGFPAHFFGRDWVSVGHRPAAWVGFAHDATTRRTLFEAFVAVGSAFAAGQRASFRGKPHGTLESITGRSFDAARVAAAVVGAYADLAGEAEFLAREAAPLRAGDAYDRDEGNDPRADPPWAATCDEAIGTLGAGPDARGTFRIGGDLLVSRDALARLEAMAAVAGPGDLDRIVDESLAAPGVAIDGVRSLESVRGVIARARSLA
jgi:hypothetical protein